MIALIKSIIRFIKLSIITMVALFAFGFALNLYFENKETVDAVVTSVEVPEVDVDESVISEYGANIALGLMVLTALFACKRLIFGLLGGSVALVAVGSSSAPRTRQRSQPSAAPRNNTPSTVVQTPAPAPAKQWRKEETKPQRTYEVKFIHISNPKTVHTLNCMVRANGLTEARMMVENNETSIPFNSMNEIVSMRMRG